MVRNRVLMAFVIAGSTAILAIGTATQIGHTASTPVSQSLEGAWLVRIGPSSRPALHSYNREGNIIIAGQLNRVGIGRWVKTGDREFALTFYILLWDTDGKSTGWAKNRSTVKLDETGNAWSGPAKADIFDNDGKLVRSVDEMHSGTRIGIEPMK